MEADKQKPSKSQGLFAGPRHKGRWSQNETQAPCLLFARIYRKERMLNQMTLIELYNKAVGPVRERLREALKEAGCE